MARLPTAVYVDGYNRYYGRLRGTQWKWLDLVALLEALLHDQDPASELVHLRYFSAPALARFATHGRPSVEAQQDYHRALLRMHAPRRSIKLGTHASRDIDSARFTSVCSSSSNQTRTPRD